MTTADPVTKTASALRIVLAAERLFARHGIDGVSLRQISAEAGSSNNSAVHYHFGSKDGLIAAIFNHRLPQVLNERRLLAARCEPDDLRARLEAHFLPLLHLAEASDNHYVSFVEQLHRHQLASGAGSGLALPELPPEGERATEAFRSDIEALLGHLDATLRQLRVSEAQVLCLHAAADRERAVTSGADRPPFELYVSSLLDGLTAFVEAPASPATLRWLDASGGILPQGLRLL